MMHASIRRYLPHVSGCIIQKVFIETEKKFDALMRKQWREYKL